MPLGLWLRGNCVFPRLFSIHDQVSQTGSMVRLPRKRVHSDINRTQGFWSTIVLSTRNTEQCVCICSNMSELFVIVTGFSCKMSCDRSLRHVSCIVIQLSYDVTSRRVRYETDVMRLSFNMSQCHQIVMYHVIRFPHNTSYC